MLKVLDADKLKGWVKAVLKEHDVIGIQARGDKFDYAALEAPEDLRLDFDVSVNAPKRFFLLPEEDLVRFRKGKASSVEEAAPFVLFGVHPYDCAALSQMETVFSLKNKDMHYLSRRENAIIIAVDVQTPSANVFSGHLGFEHVDKGYDILLTKIDDEYLVDAATAKGRSLVALGTDFKTADQTYETKRKKVWSANKEKLRKHDLKPKVSAIGKLLEKAYDHPVWKEKAKLCFSCGTCNLVCPTCYCFDVTDRLEWNLEPAARVRTWDGCMLENFATVAGDHNFRKQREERYRHRYYRKGKFVPDMIGEFSCVGCGRCIGACVSHIANPVEVYNAIMEA